MNVPEKHRAVAHAWVDGASIQLWNPYYSEWEDCFNTEPSWHEANEYRVKPKKVIKYHILYRRTSDSPWEMTKYKYKDVAHFHINNNFVPQHSEVLLNTGSEEIE